MGCQEAEIVPRAEGHPHFCFLIQGACQSHCQDNNIGVNCADEDLLVATVSNMGGMQHNAGVDLLVVARSQG